MGVVYTSQLIDEIVSASNIERMRPGKTSLDLNIKVDPKLCENYQKFYRKGQYTAISILHWLYKITIQYTTILAKTFPFFVIILTMF